MSLRRDLLALARHERLRRHIKLDAAIAGVLGAWAVALGTDYAIARANLSRPLDDQLRLITEWGRDNPVIALAMLGGLAAHGFRLFGRYDPFDRAAQLFGLR